jgi:hypothetical protein
MKRVLSLTLDQLYRPQPGGVGTYVRGLARGLSSLEDTSVRLVGVAPRGPASVALDESAFESVTVPLGVDVLTRVWAAWPLGVPAVSDVVHAATLAGPYGGGRKGAVHSVALHDLLWRDEPSASTPRGVRFHERRLRLLRGRGDVRVILTAPGLVSRLDADGFDRSRLYEVRLGVDDATTAAAPALVRSFLTTHGIEGPFTFYAGTREPRKNLERLLTAHKHARASNAELGPLVIAGPQGWGDVDASDAVVLGLVPRATLLGLYRDASVVAYVPLVEGWGLPPVEALRQGASVLASTTTPSVAGNELVVRVEPRDIDAIAAGLLDALALDSSESTRSLRQASVASLTWRNVALDHLAAWR